MENLSCCFTGHRRIPYEDLPKIKKDLSETVRVLADGGMTDFLCGGALGFDTLAAEEVLRQKETFPHIRLTLCLPCRNQAERWSAENQAVYKRILDAADNVVCLFDRYVPGCMQMRNRYMVDHARVCIAYYTGGGGGTAYTVRYAKEKNVRILYVPQKEEL